MTDQTSAAHLLSGNGIVNGAFQCANRFTTMDSASTSGVAKACFLLAAVAVHYCQASFIFLCLVRHERDFLPVRRPGRIAIEIAVLRKLRLVLAIRVDHENLPVVLAD